jgi:hypothetical protein
VFIAAKADYRTFRFLAAMNTENLAESALDERTHFLVRLAALVTLGASPLSWAMHTDAKDPEAMWSPEVIGTLIAIAPIVGTVKVTSAMADFVRGTRLTDDIDALFGE